MAQRIIIYWRDIPGQVIVRQGRTAEKRELPARFIEAIDRAAMRVGARDNEAYLAQWRRGAPEACNDDLAAEADAAVAELLSSYPRARLDGLVQAGGFETSLPDEEA
jgi:Virulence factor